MGKDLKGKELGVGFIQRPDGRYEARAKINGVRIDVYGGDLRTCREKFEEAKLNIKLFGERGQDGIYLEDWFNNWFTNIKAPQLKNDISRNSFNRKARNTFIRLLGRKRLSELHQYHVQMAANDLCEEGYAKRTIQEGVGVLRECLESAVINRMLPANPCVNIKVKDANVQKERRVLSKEEQRIFLEEIKGEYYYEAFCILLLTGMRIGEFSGLQWQDIDFTNKCIHIQRSMSTGYIDGHKIETLSTPKTYNAYRVIPFFGETEELLRSWAAKQAGFKEKMKGRWRADPAHGDLVFTTTVGSPVTRYVIVHIIKRIVDNINLKEYSRAINEKRAPVLFEHLHPHAFRHTFATRCFEKGMDPLVVQALMGHSNYATTISYTHVLDDKLKKEVESVGSFFE